MYLWNIYAFEQNVYIIAINLFNEIEHSNFTAFFVLVTHDVEMRVRSFVHSQLAGLCFHSDM